MNYQQELKVAINAVRKASRLCSKVQGILGAEAIEKKDKSPVTIADLGSQGVINLELLEVFPDDPIVAEEESELLKNNPTLCRQVLTLVNEQSGVVNESRLLHAIGSGDQSADYAGRFWTLDPIDGTKGFLRNEQYAIALALVENGEVVLGVLGCPNLMAGEKRGCILHAVKGKGAFLRHPDSDADEAVSVNSITDAKEARFCESVEKAHASHDDHLRISSALGISAPPYRIDSQAKYAAVARGNASIYLRLPRSREYREKIWDHAAGSVIVREAGGKVTDFRGNNLDFSAGLELENNWGILATNGHLHNQVLSVIRSLWHTE